jgi:hypothetical protein
MNPAKEKNKIQQFSTVDKQKICKRVKQAKNFN